MHLLVSVYLYPGGSKEMHLHLSTPVLTTLRNMGRCKQMQTDAYATNKDKPNGTFDSFGTFGTFEINDLSSNSSFYRHNLFTEELFTQGSFYLERL